MMRAWLRLSASKRPLVTSGRTTRTHRFLGEAREAQLATADTYAATLRDAKVVVDHELRRTVIEQGLAAAAETDAALARHAAYYLDLALRAEPELSGPSQVEWLERLEGERDNLRNALLWAAEHDKADMALRMAVALFHFWEARDYLTEGRGWLEQAIQASRSSNSAESRDLRVKALRCAGRLAHQQRDLSAADSFHSESLGLARELNDQLGIAAALSELAMEARLAGRLEQSTALAEESLTLCDEIGDHATTAYALLESGITWKAVSYTHLTLPTSDLV